jgi:hypothetical protein
MTNQDRTSVNSHTTINVPYLVWSEKLSRIKHDYYLHGRQIFRRDCSETVWRQGGNAIKVQMELLMPDLSKITKA